MKIVNLIRPDDDDDDDSHLNDVQYGTKYTYIFAKPNAQIFIATGQLEFEINWIEYVQCDWDDHNH